MGFYRRKTRSLIKDCIWAKQIPLITFNSLALVEKRVLSFGLKVLCHKPR